MWLALSLDGLGAASVLDAASRLCAFFSFRPPPFFNGYYPDWLLVRLRSWHSTALRTSCGLRVSTLMLKGKAIPLPLEAQRGTGFDPFRWATYIVWHWLPALPPFSPFQASFAVNTASDLQWGGIYSFSELFWHFLMQRLLDIIGACIYSLSSWALVRPW